MMVRIGSEMAHISWRFSMRVDPILSQFISMKAIQLSHAPVFGDRYKYLSSIWTCLLAKSKISIKLSLERKSFLFLGKLRSFVFFKFNILFRFYFSIELYIFTKHWHIFATLTHIQTVVWYSSHFQFNSHIRYLHLGHTLSSLV